MAAYAPNIRLSENREEANEAIKRALEALSDLSNALLAVKPAFENAVVRAVNDITKYVPIPVEGTVK